MTTPRIICSITCCSVPDPKWHVIFNGFSLCQDHYTLANEVIVKRITPVQSDASIPEWFNVLEELASAENSFTDYNCERAKAGRDPLPQSLYATLIMMYGDAR